jgi:putative peptidoglycan lipid II flippase
MGQVGVKRAAGYSAAMIAGVTILARLLGFARWAVYSKAIGSTATGSAYSAANTLPNVLFEVTVGGALAAAAVPVLALPLAQKLRGQAGQTAGALMTWAVAILVPLGTLLAGLAGPLANVLIQAQAAQVPGTVELATWLIRVFAVQVPLYGIGVVAGAVLQADKRFFWPAFAPVLSSLTVMGIYAGFGWLAQGRQDQPGGLDGVALNVLAWGTTAGVAVLTLPLLIPLKRCGLNLRLGFRFPPGVGRKLARLAGAGIGALVAQQVSVLVVAWLAGNYGVDGTLPVYHYAQAFYLLPYAVLAVPLATAAFPHLAATAGRQQWGLFHRQASLVVRAVLVVSAAGAAVLVAAAPALAAGFRLIDAGHVQGLAEGLTPMAPGLVGFGLLAVGQRVLYAAHRGRAAGLAAVVGWLVVSGVALGLVVAGGHQPGGAAASSTLSGIGWGIMAGMTAGGVAMVVAMRGSLGPAVLAGVGRTAAVALAGGVAGATLGRFVTLWLIGPGFGRAALSGTAGLVAAVVTMAAAVWLWDRTVGGVLRLGDGNEVD